MRQFSVVSRDTDEDGNCRENVRAFAMDKKRILGLVGPVILLCGVFTPAVRVPMLGTLNYFSCGAVEGTMLITFALISLWSAGTDKFRALWYTGLGSAGIVAFTYWNLFMRLSDLDLLMAQTYHLSWGWAVLIAGIGAIITAAALNENGPQHAR